MTRNEREQQFIDGLKTSLDESLHEFDAATLARLKSARSAALASEQHSPGWLFGNKMVLATGFSVLLLAGLWLFQGPDPQHLPMDELPLLTATEEFELYRNLEFYQWLEYERDRS